MSYKSKRVSNNKKRISGSVNGGSVSAPSFKITDIIVNPGGSDEPKKTLLFIRKTSL